MEFIESFMKFSFSDDDIFRIEEDELVKDVENVKACECVVLISQNVALIEAKSSSPRIDNEEKFQKFIYLRDSNIKVYNEATALENKLIVAYIPKVETQALRLPDGSVNSTKVQAWFTSHEQQEAI